MSSEIKVPISPGELIDKITILEIKAANIGDAAKLANVKVELHCCRRPGAAPPTPAATSTRNGNNCAT